VTCQTAQIPSDFTELMNMPPQQVLQLLLLSAAAMHSAVVAALPLHTSGRYIVDQNNERVKLACVNWYGADQKDFVVGGLNFASIADIAATIKGEGFNCVRLPFSVQLFVDAPAIQDRCVTKQPSLQGQNGVIGYDAVVDGLTNAGLMVILDNHMSDGDWCCSTSDENGLWYNDRYSQSVWLQTWQNVSRRYGSVAGVIGAVRLALVLVLLCSTL
jgi:endoglucanase